MKSVTDDPEQESILEAASGVFINVLLVVDTDYVRTKYSNPSKDANNPTSIDPQSQYMLCTGARGIVKNQGKNDIEFTANAGDDVSFVGTSIYANGDDAVIVYKIHIWSGDQVFNRFQPVQVRRSGAAVPNMDTANGLPASHSNINFMSLQAKVAGTGNANYQVCFGIYNLDGKGQTQDLYGYFKWDPVIHVQ